MKKLVVIGGGAAGFFCAANAASKYLQVVVLEKGSKVLAKVKVSGGGRCNVTHNCNSISAMIKSYPRGGAFLKKAFCQFFTQDTIQWFKQRGVEIVTEPDGRMFPASNKSDTIINTLLEEANKHQVAIKYNTAVLQLLQRNGGWVLHTNQGTIQADFVCVATGGFPKLEMFSWLQQLPIHIIPPVPSLFTFNIPNDPIKQLQGLSVPNAQVKIVGQKYQSTGPVLITHWGLSGPAVLKLSAQAALLLYQLDYQFVVMVNWLNEPNEQSVLEKINQQAVANHKQKVKNSNPFALPARLWEHLLQSAELDGEKIWAETGSKQKNKLAKLLCASPFHIDGKTTFKEEFVTAGGVDTNEIDSSTMMHKQHKNLFFAGEVLNIDGITGGYNFQNAWTTGWVAAKAIRHLSEG